MTASTFSPAARLAADLHETMNHVVVVLGDTSIDAFKTSGLLDANHNICAVLASTERATIEALDRPARVPQPVPRSGLHRLPPARPGRLLPGPGRASAVADAPGGVAAAAGRGRGRARPC